MVNQQRRLRSSILLIDHPSRDPPSTRVRSMQLDGKIIETSFDTTGVSKFHKYSFQNSCKDLLCFAELGTRTCVEEDAGPCLLDIVTSKVISLPKPLNDARLPLYSQSTAPSTSFYGLGYDSRIKNYKTIRIVVTLLGDGVHNFVGLVEVNALGEGSWRTLYGGNFPTGSILGKPISIDGALVWADFPQTNVAYSSQRYANIFHIDEEKFSKVGLPYGLRTGHLVGINGQLCAVDLSSDSSIRIWVLPVLNGKWESFCTIKMRVTRGEKDHRKSRVIGVLENGELLLKSYESYFVYDPATDGLAYLHLPFETDAKTEVHCYNGVSSLKTEMGTDGCVLTCGLEHLHLHAGTEAKTEVHCSNGMPDSFCSPQKLGMEIDGWEWIERGEEN